LAKRFRRRRFFLKSANQKQKLPVVAMFVNRSGQNEHSLERTFHRCFLPSFSSFGWEVSEEKIKMWKVNGQTIDDGRRTPSNGKSSRCLWQGELKKKENNNWLEFENWPLKIYIQIIKHYTGIDPSVNTQPRISCI
jgi:hypothetical protein